MDGVTKETFAAYQSVCSFDATAAIHGRRPQPMEQHVATTLGQPRFRTMLLACFASMALFLAGLGIY